MEIYFPHGIEEEARWEHAQHRLVNPETRVDGDISSSLNFQLNIHYTSIVILKKDHGGRDIAVYKRLMPPIIA